MWDARFAEPGFAYGTEPNDFLRDIASRFPAGPILSLAEGEGRNAAFLGSLGHAVHAVDGSAVGLAKAQELARQRGAVLTTEVTDLDGWQLPRRSWSGIIAFYLHLLDVPHRALFGQVADALAPGGVFALEAFAPGQLGRRSGGPTDPARLHTLAQWQDALPGLEWEIAREVERPLQEGRYHVGPALVLQLLGRRPT